MKDKKEKMEREAEKEIYINAKKEIKQILDSDDLKSKQDLYRQLSQCFKNYLSAIFKSCIYLTEQEFVKKLKEFNIDKSSIDLTDSIFKKFLQIDYNNGAFSKEDIFKMALDVEKAIDGINLHRESYHLSLSGKIAALPKEKIIKKFESNLESLKKYYIKNSEIRNDFVVHLTEYYPYLPGAQKEQFSKEYHYYCRILPDMIYLLGEIKNVKGEEKKAQLILELRKQFVKLDDINKEYFYPKISSYLTTYEQKIDLLLYMGYSYISAKKMESCVLIYNTLFNYYKYLSEHAKKYYRPVIIRYLDLIRKTQKSISNSSLVL